MHQPSQATAVYLGDPCTTMICHHPHFALLLLITLPTTIDGGWAPTKAPKWYKNFPPWWISKVDDPGYKGALPVTIAPIQPPKPLPSEKYPTMLPTKITKELTAGAKKFLDFPTKTAEDTVGAASMKNDGGQMYDAIMHANDHSKERTAGKKSADLAVLEDPVFQKQAPNVSPMKLIELHSTSSMRLLRGKKGQLPPPGSYNVPQPDMWVKTNNEKEVQLKSRVGQQLPLWDPYWQTHRNQMPTFMSNSITNNAYLHYKDSPFDLYAKNRLGASGPSDVMNKKDDNNQVDVVNHVPEPDSDW